MESVTYNGVPMTVIAGTMNSVVERSSDGVDALNTRFEIDFAGWFNPALASFDALGAAQPGNMPGLTFNNVKQLLATPRKQLTVVAGGATVISSPKAGYTVDANNGPIIEGPPQVSSMIGVRTWAIRMKIITWVGFERSQSNPILVSNRWSMMNDVAPDYRSLRFIEGVAEFRVDELRKANLNADHLRNIFASFTCPKNFRRVGVTTNALSDGASIHYRVVDQEQRLNIVGWAGSSVPTSIEGEVFGDFQRGGLSTLPGRFIGQAARTVLHPISTGEAFGDIIGRWLYPDAYR